MRWPSRVPRLRARSISGALGDVVTALKADVNGGAVTLTFDGRQGYLKSLLEQLNVRSSRRSCCSRRPASSIPSLPAEARAAVLARMRETITDRDTIAILAETKPGWRR